MIGGFFKFWFCIVVGYCLCFKCRGYWFFYWYIIEFGVCCYVGVIIFRGVGGEFCEVDVDWFVSDCYYVVYCLVVYGKILLFKRIIRRGEGVNRGGVVGIGENEFRGEKSFGYFCVYCYWLVMV